VKDIKYSIGDQVMLYSPPHARDKLHSKPWTGPRQVVEVANDHTVQIRIYPEPYVDNTGKAKKID
jgi:hypothetical protein